jgi:hypothetical protein
MRVGAKQETQMETPHASKQGTALSVSENTSIGSSKGDPRKIGLACEYLSLDAGS